VERSTFTNKWVAANPTWKSLTNTLKADRNHRITFTGAHF